MSRWIFSIDLTRSTAMRQQTKTKYHQYEYAYQGGYYRSCDLHGLVCLCFGFELVGLISSLHVSVPLYTWVFAPTFYFWTRVYQLLVPGTSSKRLTP